MYSNKTKNTWTSSRPNNGSKHNTFFSEIEEIAKEYEFDASPIILCFKNKNISSSDFSLHRFCDRRAFIVEFCQNECNISTKKGNLIKLWNTLNRIYNLSLNRPCCDISINGSSIYNNNKSLVYIPLKCTLEMIECELIQESFFSANRLYQYLNWTIRINKINKFINIYCSSNGIEMMVINSELHDKYGDILYILCIKNDIVSGKSQKWQFVKLQTAQEIMELATTEFSAEKKELLVSGYIRNNIRCNQLISCSVSNVCSVSSISNIIGLIAQYGCIGYIESINSIQLPLGARSYASQFKVVRRNKLGSKQYIDNMRLQRKEYCQLKSIRTGYDKRNATKKEVLQISLSEFHKNINYALKSNDLKHELIPIVTMLTGKQYGFGGEYHVDQLLPVNIKNNWIGIVYRNGLPVMTLIDGYDITNKAILCNPSFDESKLEWFTNNINKIEIGSSRFNKKRYHKPQQNNNNNNKFDDEFSNKFDGEFSNKFDDKFNNKFDDQFNNNYIEGNMDTGSTDNNTTNYVDVITEEDMMDSDNITNSNDVVITTDGYQQYQTTTTSMSSIYGDYQYLSVPTTATTATTRILPHKLEGMQCITNTIQFHQQQALYFGQFSNLNITTNVSLQSVQQSQNYLNNVYY